MSILLFAIPIVGIENLCAVMFLRVGLDPERTFFDDAIATIAGAGILWFFQNSWFSIVSGLVLGLFTSVAIKLVTRHWQQDPDDRRPLEFETR